MNNLSTVPPYKAAGPRRFLSRLVPRIGRLVGGLLAGPHVVRPGKDPVRVTATGNRNKNSQSDEVIVVHAVTADGKHIDLARLPRSGGALVTDVKVSADETVPLGIRLTSGCSLELPLDQGGSLLLVTHPWSGIARIQAGIVFHDVDLYGPTTGLLEFDVTRMRPLNFFTSSHYRVSHAGHKKEFIEELNRRFADLERLRKCSSEPAAEALALYTPRWKGVTAATINLFPCALPVPLTAEEHPAELDEAAIEVVADAVAASQFGTIVFSGGDRAFFRIFNACLRRRPGLDCRLLWHSSFLQMGEPHDWGLLLPWLEAAQSGRLTRFGVVKPGMERFMMAQGVPAVFVQNRVPFQKRRAANTERTGAVGLWLSGSSDYRKPVAPSLLALAGLRGVKLRGAGLGEFGCRLVDELQIPSLSKSASPISNVDVRAQMRQTDVTLYVTLSECMPMVPLESMAEGTPCLVGPATELFIDDPGLGQLLTVCDPTNPEVIRLALARVLGDQDSLRSRCYEFLDSLNQRAAQSLQNFLR